jgi:hypothetical protein
MEPVQTLVIERLSTHADAIDGEVLEGRDEIGSDVVGVDLDSDFGIGLHLIIYIDGVEELMKLRNG